MDEQKLLKSIIQFEIPGWTNLVVSWRNQNYYDRVSN